ncbi:unnamed protein product [Rotaria socialis]|uniref:C2H2-type domain-containing protein n=1 Tax=Rotaria socialis TaxID=392032 RepID=A0A818RYJ4_9BILA|nr:unnamed protein product [Rotaria socialis]CAF4465181.1 unnamed protein product [Rotaria socialis]
MSTAYICPMCVFNCDNLPDLEQHLEAHENNSIQSPVKQQQSNKSVRNSPLYAKSQSALNLQQQQQQQNRSPINNSSKPLISSPTCSSPNKTYDRRYSCKSCPFSTHSVKAYFNHRQMAHGEQLIVTECPYCDYASQYPGKVKKHLTDEHPLQQISTVKSPTQSNRTTLHGNSINNTIEQNAINNNVEKAITRFTDCPFCSFTSVDSEAFRKHVLTNHLSDKNFRCLVCNRLYRYRGDCSFHIRKKHSDRMIGDNIESLREYIGEFQPNSMTAIELKELLSCPLTPSLASIPSLNGTPNNIRQSSTPLIQSQQPNPPHAFRCGYCKFSSVNSGDVKKHQTWKHAGFESNILPIDPNDPQQQPIGCYKRKRVHSTKSTSNEDDGHTIRRARISMPLQRELIVDTSQSAMVSIANTDNDPVSGDLLSPNDPRPPPVDGDQLAMKTTNNHLSTQHQIFAIGALSSRVYKCTRCERLAPHRWIIERHIRAKHPSDSDNMSNVIIEIEKPLATSTSGEPMTATKSSSATSDQDSLTSTIPKAFSCSACSIQSYHLWVILRHIRNVHHTDGSNAKIIDNINNQIIEDSDDLESDTPVHNISSNTMTITSNSNDDHNNNNNNSNNKYNDDKDETKTQQNSLNNEEMLTRLINTAMTARKMNAPNSFLENLPTSLMNNNVAATLATLLGQLTNKQLTQQQQQQQQQQCQGEKAPLAKRYKCSLCSHISAWGGNVKKHLKRMHTGDDGGYVIDLGVELANSGAHLSTQLSLMSNTEELDEVDEKPMVSMNTTKIRPTNGNGYQLYQDFYQQSSEIVNTKLKDIDNSPSFAPMSSTNSFQSTRPERLYGCSVCSFECTNPTNIHRHVELHSGDDGGGFQCSQCFFLSKWRASIRKHMISAHGSSLASLTNVLEPLTLVKSHDATVIVKKWLIHENGIKHEDDPNNNNTHTMDASIYYCSSCPYTNNSRLSFEQHVIHHSLPKTNANVYTCTFCTFNSYEQDSFEDHQILHIMKEDFQQDATANTLENTVI